MIIDCISDLHGHYPKLDGGDLLILAGDLTARDSEKDWLDFENWIYQQDYNEKIMIAGNHDNFLSSMDEHRMWKFWEKVGVTYLCDSGTELKLYDELPKEPDDRIYKRHDLKIWGSPWSLWFHGINPKCKAFTGSENDLAKKWKRIPTDTDILISHGPPYGMQDMTVRGERVGSKSLQMELWNRLHPKLLVFGHIHECYGKALPGLIDGCEVINCSYVNKHYQPVNKPIRVIL
jgi:Icc-related predicted phosphoesterase